ncbi:sodium:solute symporter family transporter [Desulfotignum balticum]|uniref:sodium:solute symporter family transporter n=1 Tax=Desulfotignum balticum TaxID=115781 RepID=UPI0003FF4DA4|nr:hypothetical protein [Desulfotignum balticum]
MKNFATIANRSDLIRTVLYFVVVIATSFLFRDLLVNLSLGFLLFFVILLPHAFRYQKKNSSLSDYFLLDRSLPTTGFASSLLATNLSLGNYLIVVFILGYFFGINGIIISIIGIFANYLGASFLIPKIKPFITDSVINIGTINNFIGMSHNSFLLRKYCASITIFSLFLAIVFELHILTIIIANIFKLSPTFIFPCLVLIICIYASIGGFAAVVFTDLVQAAMNIVVVFTLLLFFYYFFDPSYELILSKLDSESMPWTIWVSVPTLSLFWFISSLDQWQRTSASGDISVSLKGTFWGLLGMAFIGIGFVVLGIVDNQAFLPFLNNQGISLLDNQGISLLDFFMINEIVGISNLGFVVLVLWGLALIFAALSTADTFMIAISHSIVGDYILGSRNIHYWKSKEKGNPYVKMAQGCVVFLGIFVIIIWFILDHFMLIRDPLNFFFVAYSGQFALTGSVIFAALKLKLNANVSIVSVTVGVLLSYGLGGFALWSYLGGIEPFIVLKSEEIVSLTPVFTIFGSVMTYLCGYLLKFRTPLQGD